MFLINMTCQCLGGEDWLHTQHQHQHQHKHKNQHQHQKGCQQMFLQGSGQSVLSWVLQRRQSGQESYILANSLDSPYGQGFCKEDSIFCSKRFKLSGKIVFCKEGGAV